MWVHSLFCWMNCMSMYILGIKDWLLALFIYLLDGDIFLANSHEQNMMPALVWTLFAFSYTTELICSTSWFDLLAAVTKLTSTVYQWHLNRLAAALVSEDPFPSFWYIYVHAYSLFMYTWQWCFFCYPCLWNFPNLYMWRLHCYFFCFYIFQS